MLHEKNANNIITINLLLYQIDTSNDDNDERKKK